MKRTYDEIMRESLQGILFMKAWYSIVNEGDRIRAEEDAKKR